MRTPWHRWLVPPALVLASGVSYGEQYLSLDEAQASMFPGARLSPQPVDLSADQIRAIEKASGVHVRIRRVQAWRAEPGGWFFLDQVLGKHDYITWALALDADGAVRGLEILEYRETYGSEIRNAKWRAQFTGKTHGAALKLGADVKNLSGATLSSRHITDGVKRLLATYALVFRR